MAHTFSTRRPTANPQEGEQFQCPKLSAQFKGSITRNCKFFNQASSVLSTNRNSYIMQSCIGSVFSDSVCKCLDNSNLVSFSKDKCKSKFAFSLVDKSLTISEVFLFSRILNQKQFTPVEVALLGPSKSTMKQSIKFCSSWLDQVVGSLLCYCYVFQLCALHMWLVCTARTKIQ
jgi:hypothetical protein